MKYPPVLQVIIAAAIAWGLARNIPLFGIGGSFTTFIIWGSAVLGFGLLAYALKLFRFHKTTFDPLEPTKGFVPTKVRKVPQGFLNLFVLSGIFGFFVLPFSRCFYATFFGGKMPSVSRSFSSEKSYSPSKLMWAHDIGE